MSSIQTNTQTNTQTNMESTKNTIDSVMKISIHHEWEISEDKGDDDAWIFEVSPLKPITDEYRIRDAGAEFYDNSLGIPYNKWLYFRFFTILKKDDEDYEELSRTVTSRGYIKINADDNGDCDIEFNVEF